MRALGSLGSFMGGKIGSGAFSPSNISNMVAWFDAALGITLNSGNVSDWADQSGNSNDLAQTVAADQPFYNTSNSNFNSLPSLDMDPALKEFMFTSTYAGGNLSFPHTIVVVHKFNAVVSGRYVFDGLAAGNRSALAVSGTNYSMTSGTSLVGGTVDSTNAHVLMLTFGTSATLYVDGGTPTLSGDSGTSTPMGGIVIDSNYLMAGTGLNSEFAELLVYDSEPTDLEKNQLGSYLADKYGLTWTNI